VETGVTRLAPSKILAVHLSYRSRAMERGRMPAFPSFFLKPLSSLGASGDAVLRPKGCELLAFEGEIALVLGSRIRDVDPETAWEAVEFVTAANDFGVYDMRYADAGSNVRSKGVDGFTPIGPELIDAQKVIPSELRIQTWVNGDVVQDAVVGEEMLFSFGEILADASRFLTLEPGDVVLTGTPTGSSVVQPGDVVEVEVRAGNGDSSGRLRSPIAEDDRELAARGAKPRPDDVARRDALGGPHPSNLDARFPPEIVQGLHKVSTATLASQLRKRGLNGCTLDGLRPTRPELRLLGTARTVRYMPHREDLFDARGGGMNAQKRSVESILPGEVLVIEARGEPHAGTIGDILALRARVRGASGIITDGALRDSAAITALDVPTYFGSVHPAVLGRHHVPWETDVAVGCAGVLIEPGDLLVGDADGVVVVPAHLVVDVVTESLEQERQERFISEQVALGASIAGLYPIGESWKHKYAAWQEDDVE
jgi:regulator of RNase E activity RraA/2-keto-4-pentenoate hydratase/2-oxohepta-3-ene-1,7-dioic acid hydratase in catechol pathway